MITTWKNFEGEIGKVEVASNCDIYWCTGGFLKCFADLVTKNICQYRSGTLNSKFHLIRSFC